MQCCFGPRKIGGTTLLIAVLLFCLRPAASATTRYVDLNNPTPASPYTNWLSAATSIQDAIDAAAEGDLVLVTNGVYATGGRAVYGAMTNRVAVDKPLTLRSVNGPEFTVIEGYQVPGTTIGDGAIRCVFLTNGAFLAGFTLSNGATRVMGDSRFERSGGGLLGWSTSAVASNCVFTANSAQYGGGGAALATLLDCVLAGNHVLQDRGGGGGATDSTLRNCIVTGNSSTNTAGGGVSWSTVHNCLITGNVSVSGGGASKCTLHNCTITGNRATRTAGGVIGGTIHNSIVYYNCAAHSDDNYTTAEATTLDYCCTTPLPPSGSGNVAADPQLASTSHLAATSPCRGAGSPAYATGFDIDGEPWATPPDIGCDQFLAQAVTGALTVAIAVPVTNIAVGYSLGFEALIAGQVSASVWDFGDGVIVSNRPYAAHAWAAPGDYTVRLRAFNDTFPLGVQAAVTVRVGPQPVHYVSLNSPSPVPPYTSWDTATTNLQEAVDAATLPGALVLASNGVYELGAREINGMSNRLAVTKPIIVQSLNGPAVTTVRGYQVPGTKTGPSAVRCLYLAGGAVLSGFTLANGATRADGDFLHHRSGGGAWCDSRKEAVSNCVLTGNAASHAAGGTSSGTLNNCVLSGNSATWGGGAWYATLNNCAAVGNSAAYAGGASYSTLNNCISYYNTATSGYVNYYGGSLSFCCTTPLPTGPSNFTTAPLFVDTNGWGNLRLQTNSPCINAGNNAYAPGPTDLDDNPRIAGGRVDVGAYEFQGAGLSGFTGWLWQYGLPTDGSADYADTDNDQDNNWQEWIAGTVPTNAASVLLLAVPATGTGTATLTWLSVTNRSYYVERATDLASAPAFSLLQSNIPGLPGTTSFTDTNPPSTGPAFYRVGIQP